MLETVTAYIEQHQLLPERGEVVVAVSGGADSLCLLHLLQRLCGPGKRYPAVRLHVAHLNHQLRGEASERDAAEVTRIAEGWGLAVTVGSVDVPALARREQRSLEDAARTARYRFLREVARGQPIAVGHHQDDQVETLLLHWLRGGGMSSMVGLQARQQDIIRPLLAVTHEDTVAYCRQWGLQPLEDASNADTRFLRNRIRHELLPLLEEMNAGIRETLVRNAEVMRVDVEWIEAQVDRAWPTVVVKEEDSGIEMASKELLALPLSLQRHVLRRASAQLCEGQSPLELRHYMLIEQLVRREEGRREVALDMPGRLRVARYGGRLVFERGRQRRDVTQAWGSNAEVVLPIPGEVVVPGTAWRAVAEVVSEEEIYRALHAGDWGRVWKMLARQRYTVYINGDGIGDRLYARTRRAGDRIRPLGMAQERKVQDVLVDRHIPRTERDRIPLFFTKALVPPANEAPFLFRLTTPLSWLAPLSQTARQASNFAQAGGKADHCVWLAGVQLDDRVRLDSGTRRIICLSLRPARLEEGNDIQ